MQVRKYVKFEFSEFSNESHGLYEYTNKRDLKNKKIAHWNVGIAIEGLGTTNR